MDDLRNIIKLAMISGIGHGRLRTLVEKFGTAGKVFRASMEQLTATSGLDKKTAEKIRYAGFQYDDAVDEQYQMMEKYAVRCITWWDEEYPSSLRNIYDPPAFLFVRGSLAPSDGYSVAIVGTREPTAYGKSMTEMLSRELALRGITIVSGLARGIDTLAHQAALNAGGRTLAVLGCGADRIYPPENYRLASEIIRHGAVLADYLLKTPPEAGHFPGRNRIISGLSLGTVVVEAGERSGALITAGYALDQNRELFAVPGQANVPQAKGTNRLIKQGAVLVDSVEDILAALEPKLPAITPPPAETIPYLSDSDRLVYDCLSPQPLHIDEIARKTNLSVNDALARLLNLELQGVARQLAGKLFIKG